MGKHYTIVKTDSGANVCRLYPNGTDQIDGVNNYVVASNQYIPIEVVDVASVGWVRLDVVTFGVGATTTQALFNAHFWLGNGSNIPASVAMGGDCSLANTGSVTCTKTNGTSFAPSATTDTTNASNISSGTLAAASGGAGTITGALKGNGSGTVSHAACADLSDAATSCSTDATDASNISSGTLAAARGGAGTTTGALKGNGSGTVSQAACADLSDAATSCSTDATDASNISSGTLGAELLPTPGGAASTGGMPGGLGPITSNTSAIGTSPSAVTYISVPANSIRVGTTYRLTAYGTANCMNSSQSSTMDIYWGTTHTSASDTLLHGVDTSGCAVSSSSLSFKVGMLIVFGRGGSATAALVTGEGAQAASNGPFGVGLATVAAGNSVVTGLNITTAGYYLSFIAGWGAGSNTFTFTNAVFELVQP